MINVLWFLGYVIILLILWVIITPEDYSSKPEPFDGIKPRVHAKIGGKGEVLYYSWQSPSQNGELGCTQVPCPKYLEDNVTCWCCCNFH